MQSPCTQRRQPAPGFLIRLCQKLTCAFGKASCPTRDHVSSFDNRNRRVRHKTLGKKDPSRLQDGHLGQDFTHQLRGLGPISEILAHAPAPPDVHPRRQQVTQYVVKSLPSTWETWNEFQVPGFGLTQPQLLWAFEGVKRQIGDLSARLKLKLTLKRSRI